MDKKIRSGQDQAPPIKDYGYIGDCHSSALISIVGSIDWCCMPRIDSSSCFGRLLGWETGGYCQIAPIYEFVSSHHYEPGTMILVTTFKTDSGEARIYDFMPMRRGGAYMPYNQIIRVVEGVKGEVELNIEVVPRFDYGAIKPWLRPYKKTTFVALGGCTGLLISSDLILKLAEHHSLFTSFKILPNTRHYLSIIYSAPEDLDNLIVEVPSHFELDFRLDETRLWWQSWVQQGTFKGSHAKIIERSALVLKSLQTAPTGAIAAAATTSLPEEIGGCRNWDYRFSWIRDSYFSVRSLARLGFVLEADGFRRFIERSCHSSPDGLQTLFGVYGERRLHECIITEMSGYRGSQPVRVGNEAALQLQLDMFGLLVDLAWIWHTRGSSPDKNYWVFLKHIVNFAIAKWRHPDSGIWEMRGEPRHFINSKMMCWVAVDRGIKMAQDLDFKVPMERWIKQRDKIRQYIETKGYDEERGVFIQAHGYPQMDASLLLLGLFEFVSFDDPRFIRTMNQIRKDLEVNGLLLRYGKYNDGLEGTDGAFLACTFWLVLCLAKQGQVKEAKKIFNTAISTSNDLFLFSEEYDPHQKVMLGNFPQGFTHLSLISAALALDEAEEKANKKP